MRGGRLLRRYALTTVLRLRPPGAELEPDRLYAYLDALFQTRLLPGAVLEVGCFRGGTTRLAYGFLQATQSTKRYLAIDTFAGFVGWQFERDRRHGTSDHLRTGFGLNDLGAVRRSLDANGCRGVELLEGDVVSLPDALLPERIAVALLDVDLEVPTYEALRRITPRLSPGAIVLVDDCDPENAFPGAIAGYRRFAVDSGRPEEYFMRMGIVRGLAAGE